MFVIDEEWMPFWVGNVDDTAEVTTELHRRNEIDSDYFRYE
jgi:hypothetical protein